MLRPVVRKLAWAVAALLLVGAGGVALVYHAFQHVPTFYQAALAATASGASGAALMKQVTELQNDARRGGPWEVSLTAEDLNAWLAAELANKHPGTLPTMLREPRVQFSEQGLRVALRWEQPPWRAVLSLTADLYLTDTPNELAVRIREFHAGRLPLPLKQLVEQVSAQARQQGWPLRWSQERADPVALIQLPTRYGLYPDRELCLESVALRDGRLLLSGRTRWVK